MGHSRNKHESDGPRYSWATSLPTGALQQKIWNFRGWLPAFGCSLIGDGLAGHTAIIIYTAPPNSATNRNDRDYKRKRGYGWRHRHANPRCHCSAAPASEETLREQRWRQLVHGY